MAAGWRFVAAALLLPAAILGTLAYVQRDLVEVRWHVGQAVAGKPLAPRAKEWLLERRELAAPAALRHFGNARGAAGAGAALAMLLQPHGHDPDLAYLGLSTMRQLRGQYRGLPPEGRAAAAEFAARFLGWHLADRFSGVPTLLDTAGEIVALALEDADPRVRGPALDRMADIWRLPAIGGPPAKLDVEWRSRLCGEIARNLASESEGMRARAAWAMVDAPAREHDKELRQLAFAPDEPAAVRSAAFAALASGDDDRFGPARSLALTYLHDDDPRVREAARRLVRGQRDEAEVAWLLRATDPDPQARAAAAAAALEFARNGDADFALAWLKRLAADPDRDVRRAAAETAGRWPNPGAEGVVKLLSRDDDTVVSAAAAKELQRLSRGPAPERK